MAANRREFFGLLGAGSVLIAAGVSAKPDLSREPLGTKSARAAFAFDEKHIPMNAANLCPSPQRVADAVSRFTTLIDGDPSFQNRAQFGESLKATRSGVARQLGVSANEVALVRNTSEANNIVGAGLDLGRGDQVLLWDQNHPSNGVAWDVRARRYGFEVQRVSVPAMPAGIDELLDPFLANLSPRTRVLSVSHISNISGLRLPVAELGAVCRQRGIHFHIDGAQTWGAEAIDLRAVGCDSFSASAHKWYMGPKEVGLLYLREEAQAKVWPAVVSYGWGADEVSDLDGARKFEALGQRDDAALVGLREAVAMHDALGLENEEAHTRALATRLKQGMTEIGMELITPMQPEFSSGVCIGKVAPEQRARLFNELYERYGIIGAPTGGLRLCPHVYNTPEHVDRAVRGIREILVSLS
ncbi:MAG: aminotransferase class V-fold PLP-dependent enzyme [Pseudomonadota bacterium]